MTKEQADQLYRQASRLHASGQHAEALLVLEQLDAAFPNQPAVRNARVKCLEALSASSGSDQTPGTVPSEVRQRRTQTGPSLLRARSSKLAVAVLAAAALVFAGIAVYSSGSDEPDASPVASPQPRDAAPANADPRPKPATRPAKWDRLGLAEDFRGTRVGIDMAKYMNPEPFDQDREVERVLEEVRAGKGVPPVLDTSNPNHALWMRATYQDIIDAARAAFHKHRDPVTGAPGRREETITVPGNATGKDELRIVYMSGESTGNLTWGDDEDVVYVTGSTVIHEPQTLRILPGTIILVAAFQDDQKDGAMTEEMVGAIHALYSSDPAGQELSDLFGQDMAFRKRHCEPAVVGVLLARGTEAGPILLVGDEGTPYDFRNWHFWNGIVDYVVSENSTLFDSESRNTLTARSKFDNHWGSGRNGAGWVVANYFGDCWYECVDIHSGKLDVLYNIFNSRTAAGGVTLADSPGSVVVEFNTFRANHVSVIETYSGIGSSAISRNNFLPQDLVPSNPYVFVQRSQHPIDATGNYWGRSTEARDSAIFDGNDEPRFARLGIHPCLSHPVPMPFKTGIPEIDNVRD